MEYALLWLTYHKKRGLSNRRIIRSRRIEQLHRRYCESTLSETTTRCFTALVTTGLEPRINPTSLDVASELLTGSTQAKACTYNFHCLYWLDLKWT